MAWVDLRNIKFRAHEEGDEDEPFSLGPLASGSNKVSLAGIKFRSNNQSEDENANNVDIQGA
jgi:hypothetical protein